MKKIILLVAIALLAGCSDREQLKTEYLCADESNQDRSSFILQCLSNANPKSDEEPEDWILMCERMAERAHCETAQFKYTYTHGWDLISKVRINNQ